jgi:hypothetical protein
MFSESFQNAQPTGRLDVGLLLRHAVGAIARNLPALLLWAAFLVAVPGAIDTFVDDYLNSLPAEYNPKLWNALVTFLTTVTFTAVFNGAAAWIVSRDLSGAKGTALSAWRATVPAILWVTEVAIACNFIEGVATLLLIVPGIIAALALSVTAPACVIEKLNVNASIRRSLYLTRGQRWRLLWAFLAIYAAYFLLIILTIVARDIARALNPSFATPVFFWGKLLSATFGTIGIAAGMGSAYAELRRIKEGVSFGDLAAVFA